MLTVSSARNGIAVMLLWFPFSVIFFAVLPAMGSSQIYTPRGGTKLAGEPVDEVSVFTGTSKSRWMLFPGATVPMSLVKFSPDNQGNVWNGEYECTVASISGFSFLHSFGLSSMSVMPFVGEMENEPGKMKLFPGRAIAPSYTPIFTVRTRRKLHSMMSMARTAMLVAK